MNLLSFLLLIVAAGSTSTGVVYTPDQLGIAIETRGAHVTAPNGKRLVRYSYTIRNLTGYKIRGVTVGRDSVAEDAQYLLNDSRFAIDSRLLGAPTGWEGVVNSLEETTLKYLRWTPHDDHDMEFGIDAGEEATFHVHTDPEFPELLSTRMMIIFKTFAYRESPVVQLSHGDTSPPQLTTRLKAPRTEGGYIAVRPVHEVLDNQDPAPLVFLADVESNQALAKEDVRRNASGDTVHLKHARGRTYTLTYVARDASGNEIAQRQTIASDP